LKTYRSEYKFFDLLLIYLLLLFITVSASSLPLRAEESHPGLMAEALYSEALIAFHRQQIDEANRILDGLLSTQPNYAEALELRALILKEKGKEDDAAQIYEKLMAIRPPNQQAPYQYELGLVYFHRKEEAKAKSYFEKALMAGFNTTICRFFLGTIAFNQGNNRYAEYYFRKVARTPKSDIRLLALYYLGLIELRTNYPLAATRDLLAAEKLAQQLPPSATTQQIGDSAKQVLAPFQSSQVFASVTAMGEYNSNISQLPTSLTSSSQSVSGQSTGVFALSGGAGYMTAPLNDFQFVGSYHFALNLDTSSLTKNYQFVTNTVSAFLNYLPLAGTQAGFKVEGNFIFQDNPVDASDPTGSYQYTKYLLGAEIGPYFRYQISREVQTEFDLYFRPQSYYTETELSGLNTFARLSVKADLLEPYFNPSGYLEYEHDNTDSYDFKANTVGFGFSNLMKLTARDFVTPGIDFLFSVYAENELGRDDHTFMAHLDYAHVISSHFSVLGNVSYTDDVSTQSGTYSYTQALVGLGVSYNL
jgi:tetratricopeptide (TPR) repeat protein